MTIFIFKSSWKLVTVVEIASPLQLLKSAAASLCPQVHWYLSVVSTAPKVIPHHCFQGLPHNTNQFSPYCFQQSLAFKASHLLFRKARNPLCWGPVFGLPLRSTSLLSVLFLAERILYTWASSKLLAEELCNTDTDLTVALYPCALKVLSCILRCCMLWILAKVNFLLSALLEAQSSSPTIQFHKVTN